jgi:hypothetical protein
MRTRLVVLLVALAAASFSAQQPTVRRSTNIAALASFPSFYNLRPVLLVGSVSQRANGDLAVSDGSTAIQVVAKGGAPDGLDEVRGEFWDLGRMNPDDPRLAPYDVKATFHIDPEAGWPRPGQVTAVVSAAVTPASPPSAASIHGMVLYPSRFVGEKVTITGQFAGRNLLGELPDAPARSRYDFVLRTADAAIWITNLRPRGKDFELALDTRIDTGRWLEVTGTLQQGRGLQWLDAAAGSLALTKAPVEKPLDEPIRIAIAPPPEVLFSAPTEDESDVLLNSRIRVQFSRDIDPASLKGHVQVKYDDRETIERGEPATPSAEFTTQYSAANRTLEISFPEPLERFRHVIVTLDASILGTDKQPLKPWTLNFHTGGT